MSDEKQTLREQDSQRLYDFKNEETEQEYFREKEGLTKETVLRVSEEKRDPSWMRDFSSPKRASSPCTSMTTEPSGMFFTQPVKPSSCATPWTNTRKPTP